MTPSPHSRPSFAPSDPIPVATLLTALPGLLGFIPERSMTLIAFRADRTPLAIMRHDLILTGDGDVDGVLLDALTRLGDLNAIRYEADSVVAVVVDDRVSRTDPRHHALMEVVDRSFAEMGGLAAGFVLQEVAEGAPFATCWWAGSRRPKPVLPTATGRGVLGDPLSSPTAVAAAVRTGRQVLRHRSDLNAMLMPDLCDCGICISTRDRESPAGPESGFDETVVPLDDASGVGLFDTDMDRSRALRTVIDAVLDTETPGCIVRARLGRAICDVHVRDALLGLAVTDWRHDAERLWRHLARTSTGTARASAATLLAHAHYIRGEGVYAGVALDAALAADPEWSFADLLDQALRAGADPEILWQVIGYSFTLASELGVPLPQPTLAPRAG